ncbi:MAG: hypothetical protein R3F60_10095 [bacterium]
MRVRELILAVLALGASACDDGDDRAADGAVVSGDAVVADAGLPDVGEDARLDGGEGPSICASAVGTCTEEESHCTADGQVEACAFAPELGCIAARLTDCAAEVGPGSTCQADGPLSAVCSAATPDAVCPGSTDQCAEVGSRCGADGALEICALDDALGCIAYRVVDCAAELGAGAGCEAESPTAASCVAAPPPAICPEAMGVPGEASTCGPGGTLETCALDPMRGCIARSALLCEDAAGPGATCVAQSETLATCEVPPPAPICPGSDCVAEGEAVCGRTGTLDVCRVDEARGCVDRVAVQCTDEVGPGAGCLDDDPARVRCSEPRAICPEAANQCSDVRVRCEVNEDIVNCYFDEARQCIAVSLFSCEGQFRPGSRCASIDWREAECR